MNTGEILIKEEDSKSYQSNLKSNEYENESSKQITNYDKSSSPSKSLFKGEQLFFLHKEHTSKRVEVHKKAEVEKVVKELEYCTFSPEVHKYERKDNEEEFLNRQSYSDYVDRVRNSRENKKVWKDKCELRSGCGKIWKKLITVPDDESCSLSETKNTSKIRSKYFASSAKKSSSNDTSSKFAIKDLIEITETEGIKIEEPMKFKIAVKFLHDILHKMHI